MRTSCWSPKDRRPIGSSRKVGAMPRSWKSSEARALWDVQSTCPHRSRSSRPMKMFSMTFRSGYTSGSWYTVAMPMSWATLGEARCTGRPS